MDMEGSLLSLDAVELLRKIETSDVRNKQGSILPCASDIKRCGKYVKEYGQVHAPFIHTYVDDGAGQDRGECIEWDIDKLLETVLKAYGLWELAKTRNVRINISTDGAMISKQYTMYHLISKLLTLQPGIQ